MKRLFDKTDLTTLWEEDGDLQRMKAFFHTIEADTGSNEQIKQSVKQKALDKIARTEGLAGVSVNAPSNDKEGFAQRIRTRLLRLGNFGRWKLSLPIAGLVILLIIGQGALNGSWNTFPRMGSVERLTQSKSMPPQAAQSNGAMGIGGGFTAQDQGFNDSTTISGGTEPQANSMYSTENSSGMRKEAISPVPPDQADIPPADTEIPRKITHDLNLTLEVATINDVVTQISEKVQQLGGYVVTSQQSGSDYHSSAQLTVKIPADKLSGLQDSFLTWGKVLERRLQANDITNQYYDSQVRLQILEAEEKRYLEILNQAKTVDDVLNVENALSNVRQQIEHLKGQLKLWNNQVDYSTVTLQIVTQEGPKVNVKNPWQPISWSETWKAAGDAVLKTLSSTWNGLNYLVVGIGYASPYLLIGAMGWGIYRVWKKRRSE